MNASMISMLRALKFFLLAGLVLPAGARAETADEAIVRATAAVQAATPRAQADPSHPVFHITSPAQWMNDPNGPVFYKGVYHLFYQLTPFSDESGVKYWGHVCSRDLVKWEHLPIAIAPSNDRGEDSAWSGCCTINGLGQPMIFYTSIGRGKSPFDQAAQWAALGDKDLIHWQKPPGNPVLPESVNAGTKIYDWRDPFVFHAGKKTFLVTGGHLARDRQADVNIYEAENAALTRWKYRGPLFQIPDAPTVECPNFFQLDGQWVLFVSPYGRVQYFIGDFDAATCRFTARTHGLVDYGSSFYAPNTMLVPDGRRLVWGWVNGFPPGHGWNGCLSLPRQLSLSPDGQLRQIPAPQLAGLRGKKAAWRNVRLPAGGETFRLPDTNTLEIRADISCKAGKNVTLEIKGGGDDPKPVVIRFDGAQLTVLDATAPLQIPGDWKKLSLRIFIDRSVLEVFANETVCVTKTIPLMNAGATLQIRDDDGGAGVKRLEAWPLKTIW
jgi:beta-fructofuranosidase